MSINTLTSKQLAEALQVSTETLRRWVKAGDCPPPVTLTAGTIRFLESDVEAWIVSRTKPANDAVGRELASQNTLLGELLDRQTARAEAGD